MRGENDAGCKKWMVITYRLEMNSPLTLSPHGQLDHRISRKQVFVIQEQIKIQVQNYTVCFPKANAKDLLDLELLSCIKSGRLPTPADRLSSLPVSTWQVFR